jgi:thiol:disulfide interchange protein
VKAKFRLAPENAKPGEAITLTITMQLEPGWHTFALDHDSSNVGIPTVIELLATDGLKLADEAFSPTLPPDIETIDGGKQQRIHHKEISWSRQYTVETPEYGVRGELRYQICREGQCRPTKKVPFELGAVKPEPTVGPDVTPEIAVHPLGEAIGFEEILPAFKGKQFQPIEVQQSQGEATAGKSDESLALYLLYAFLGGLILNVMPCVLPVIAIKVLSFVQQAGESRHRILFLNLMYSAGVIVVFLMLASLAVFAKYGWGGLFQKPEFQLVMSLMVFAMGLSLLGVFEIPVPGLIGSAASQQHQEGLTGAFLTGMFATLMATPCSGPFLGR